MNTSNRNSRQKIIEQIVGLSSSEASLTDQQLKALILRVLVSNKFDKNSSLSDNRKLADKIFADMRGLDVLQELFEDPEITEIMVNGPHQIFYEKSGLLHSSNLIFEDSDHLRSFIDRCFGRANKLISEQSPISGMRLDDGSRVQAVLEPAAAGGPYISIRRYGGIKPAMNKLIQADFISSEMADLLKNAVLKKRNIIISGGTGTGKTTFLNALSGYIPCSERIVTIEDEAELNLQNAQNLVKLQARKANPDGSGEISLSDLIRISLRLRPDRIIVGEVRGCEAYEMIQAMHTGHPGSMSTGHGNSTIDMLERLSLMLIMHSPLPWDACRRLVGMAAELVIQLERSSEGHRRVKEIIEVKGVDNGEFCCERLFHRTDEFCIGENKHDVRKEVQQ